jgi:hypothetical protein
MSKIMTPPGACPDAMAADAATTQTHEPSASFTAGPWFVLSPTLDGYATIRDGDGAAVAAIAFRVPSNWNPRPSGNLPEPEADANARLIAAAPELYALLREGLESAWCDAVIGCAAQIEPKRAAVFRDHFYDWQRRTRAALAKAEGGR